jgi:pimeloyl-ACP methyl ester carboxylesterase
MTAHGYAPIPDPAYTGRAPFRDYHTWFRVTGNLESTAHPPLVVLHGGPGCAHNYVAAIADLGSAERAVIHYDQLGCGNSTRLRDHGAEFWTVELFLDELDNLLRYLDIAEESGTRPPVRTTTPNTAPPRPSSTPATCAASCRIRPRSSARTRPWPRTRRCTGI